MTDQKPDDTIVPPPLLKPDNPLQIIEELKSARRDEVLSRLVSLLNAAFRQGLRTKTAPNVQQKWFTIFGYLAQVTARVVRDLEYEKLRADIEDLKQQVLKRSVVSPRRSKYSPRAETSTRSARK